MLSILVKSTLIILATLYLIWSLYISLEISKIYNKYTGDVNPKNNHRYINAFDKAKVIVLYTYELPDWMTKYLSMHTRCIWYKDVVFILYNDLKAIHYLETEGKEKFKRRFLDKVLSNYMIYNNIITRIITTCFTVENLIVKNIALWVLIFIAIHYGLSSLYFTTYILSFMLIKYFVHNIINPFYMYILDKMSTTTPDS